MKLVDNLVFMSALRALSNTLFFLVLFILHSAGRRSQINFLSKRLKTGFKLDNTYYISQFSKGDVLKNALYLHNAQNFVLGFLYFRFDLSLANHCNLDF